MLIQIQWRIRMVKIMKDNANLKCQEDKVSFYGINIESR